MTDPTDRSLDADGLVVDPEAEGLPATADDDSTADDAVNSARIADGPQPAALPADHPIASTDYGTTPAEARTPEPLADRLDREEPDIDPYADDTDLGHTQVDPDLDQTALPGSLTTDEPVPTRDHTPANDPTLDPDTLPDRLSQPTTDTANSVGAEDTAGSAGSGESVGSTNTGGLAGAGESFGSTGTGDSAGTRDTAGSAGVGDLGGSGGAGGAVGSGGTGGSGGSGEASDVISDGARRDAVQADGPEWNADVEDVADDEPADSTVSDAAVDPAQAEFERDEIEPDSNLGELGADTADAAVGADTYETGADEPRTDPDQVGRLVTPDEGAHPDTERTEIASEAPSAGGLTAEEAAIHEQHP